MANWKKLIYSGSEAIVSSLSVDTTISAEEISGSFSGSFQGDGSSLTGITVNNATTVEDTFISQTAISVSHNFGTKNIIVSIYNSEDEQIIPSSVVTTNDDVVDITLSSPTSGRAVVVRGGHILSGSVLFENILNKPTLLSSSAQIAGDITGSFTSTSSSIASDISDLVIDSGSFSTRITDLESFSSSLDATFATDAELSALSSSAASALTSLSSSASTSRNQLVSDYIAADSVLSASVATDVSTNSNNISTNTSDINTLNNKTLFSGSSQVTLQNTTGNLSGSRIISVVSSASHAEFSDNSRDSVSSSYAFTASYALNAAGGGGSDTVGYSNPRLLTSNYVTEAGTNNSLIGPINLSSSVEIEIVSGSYLKIEDIDFPTLVQSSSYSTSASYSISASYYGGIVTNATTASYALVAAQSVNNNTSSGSLSFWQGSQAEYDLISASADNNTVYFVVE